VAKTVKLENVKARANALFRESVNEYSAQRRAVQHFVSSLLMDYGAYKGFSYLGEQQVPAGSTVGIIRGENGAPHQFPDDSRIEFI
jgi:hypothetical protein